jgi:Rrf2 family protein
MRISTKIRYGLRALVDLALFGNGQPVEAPNIAERQAISKKYLDSLLATLKSAGLVKSERGSKGGYMLARAPEEITVENVILAFEGPISLVDCVIAPDSCPRSDNCPTIDVWREINHAVQTVVRKVTVAELAARTQEKARLVSLERQRSRRMQKVVDK